jgi:hypothetical protein
MGATGDSGRIAALREGLITGASARHCLMMPG